MYYKSAVVKTDDYQSKKNTVEAGAKFHLSGIGLGQNAGWNKTEITERNTKNTSWQGTINVEGGNTSGLTINIDANQNTSYSVNQGSWAGSIDDKTSVLMDLDWNHTFLIYEFIDDPVKKKLLKDACLKYIEDHAVVDLLDVTPLYIYYNGADKKKGFNHFTTIDPTIDELYKNWDYHGVDGYVLKENLPGTIPLYIYYHEKRFNHFTSTDPNIAREYADWKALGRAGYIYKNKQEGTIPLYQYYHAAGFNHYTTTNYDIRYYQGWTQGNAIGYVYPKDEL